MIACIRIRAWPEAEEPRQPGGVGGVDAGIEDTLVERLAALVPRLVVEKGRGLAWADVRGLPVEAYARALADAVADTPAPAPSAAPSAPRTSSTPQGVGVGSGGGVGVGLAAVPIAAEVAARLAERVVGDVVIVPPGTEREFLGPLPLALLEPDARLAALLDGVGVRCCGELATLAQEPVEVRFGPEGVRLWKLARADDPRRLFGAPMRERPQGSIDFADYVVTDPARLVFTANALLGPICEALRERGEQARRLVLRLALADGGTWRWVLGAGRPTASRERWLRLVRRALDRVTVSDAVTGVTLEAGGLEVAVVQQGDLFDPGFATAGAAEAAVARLVDGQGAVVLAPETDAHPLAERAVRWVPEPADAVAGGSVTAIGRRARTGALRTMARIAPMERPQEEQAAEDVAAASGDVASGETALTLQLLPRPRPIKVETAPVRHRQQPIRFRDREGWQGLVVVAGPDRVSGGQWDEPYAREYFRCVTDAGVLVWIYHDARARRWFLHGWWD
jgi:protein ImuB